MNTFGASSAESSSSRRSSTAANNASRLGKYGWSTGDRRGRSEVMACELRKHLPAL
ncbi:hypothetical protein OHR86_00480 [Streptomyces sp. NBC_00441]|uniref:hypothetical protein n=1 Tax=Streptomyces sp. NBC_00441 TaxID=2975742 RepID=UPI002E2B095A|nr:hypothetical protein [Streptomyces sp. NBC_00441]